MKPHKHAELIHAWADGAEIEVFTKYGAWDYCENPCWSGKNQYRIKPQKWEPKGGIYFVSQSGFVHNDDSTDECREFGMEFETEDAAEIAAVVYRRYHRLYKLAEELNEGWEPDWSDNSQDKLIIRVCYDTTNPFFYYSCDRCHGDISGIHFKDEDTAKKAIKIIEAGGLE